ncbi:probable cation-transporting ATPase 13A4 isoform X1 [Microcaecilia unicolor]|uniref:Cation-transporting ATPase n=1 Tax=Microcaecilia unicolor TaxID=1415580 RepID=A0A6P7ZAM0_9AMPH|nr:probable cation-transporting ATPase 13A4 isoform X1 [Microcaecilia unicolor]
MLGEKKKDHCALLNEGEENEMEIYGYRMNVLWIGLCIAGYILSGGILLLLFYWKPEWSVWANCSPCSLKKANVILLRETDGAKKYTRKKVRWIQLSSLAKSLKGKPVESIITDESFLIHKATTKPGLKVKYIRVQKIRYVWDNTSNQFKKIGTLEDEHSCSDIHSKFGSGLTKEEGDIRRLVCGSNTIEVEIAPLWKLFFKEVINLFYIYQFFTVGLWLSQGYLGYSIAIIFLCTVTITLSLYELRQQSVKLHKLVEAHNNVKVTVCRRNGEYSELESRHLVPGDVIILKGEKFFLSCDAILINGVCILNEGMLTGECIPVTKTSLPSLDKTMPWKKFSGEDYKRHVLFCGTEVIRTEASAQGPVRAVVLRTGFNTTKGDMVRSILYPKPVHFKLHRDVKRFFMFLAFLALIGIVYSTAIFAMRGMPAGRIIIEALVLVTSAICPIIPAALTVGILYAQSRLKKESIYSISPHRINMCGQINLFCFDKTGTLTEDGLDLLGIIPSEGNCFQKMHTFSSGSSLPWSPLFGALVSCHSLLILDGELQGDPLDLKMFEATNWEIEDHKTDMKNAGDSSEGMVLIPGPNANVDSVKGITVLNQYPFSSSLQRMAVITQAIGEEKLVVYMKGAPEMVARFCKPETVPGDFSSQLELYTFQGFRVIGLAYKAIEPGQHNGVESLTRENVESELQFLGFLILENRLKPETVGILTELNAANIRIVMLTGDNIQTAATVAKTSGMIPENGKVVLVEAHEPNDHTQASITWRLMEYSEKTDLQFNDACIDVEVDKVKYHFALSGKSYEVLQNYFPSYLPKILMNGTVFARVSPLQKATLIEDYRSLDYYVGMCGDGANDCAALKTAHAGISLSEQEASVAAPFNSGITNISCVTDLLKEGRAALVTSFCMFKYMSLFGIIEYNNTLLLYWQRNIFGNNQFLVHDFAVMFVIFLTMSSTHAYPKLAPYRPPGQLISPPMLLSVIFNICFSVAMETYAFVVVQQQPWYSATDMSSGCPGRNSSMSSNYSSQPFGQGIAHISYESTTLWLITANHFVIIAFVFSKGKPFRQPVYKNYIFVCALLVEVAFTLFIIFADIEGLYIALELVCTPTLWRVHMLIILVVCFVILTFVEDIILDNRALWIALKNCFRLSPSSQYKKLRNVLDKDPDWPPLNRTIYADQVGDGADSKLQVFSNPAFEKNEK